MLTLGRLLSHGGHLDTTLDINIRMPVLDYTYSTNPFIPADPWLLLAEGSFSSDVEVMLGTNQEEGIIFMIGKKIDWNLPPHNLPRYTWKQLLCGLG